MKFCYNTNSIVPLLNNPKDLDPNYKTDLELWDRFGRKKTVSYDQRDMLIVGRQPSITLSPFHKLG